MKIMMAFGVEWHFSYFADEKPWKHEKISSVDMEIQLKLAISFITLKKKMWIKMYFLASFFSCRSKKSLKQLFMKNKSTLEWIGEESLETNQSYFMLDQRVQ